MTVPEGDICFGQSRKRQFDVWRRNDVSRVELEVAARVRGQRVASSFAEERLHLLLQKFWSFRFPEEKVEVVLVCRAMASGGSLEKRIKRASGRGLPSRRRASQRSEEALGL